MTSKSFEGLPVNFYDEDIMSIKRFGDEKENIVYLSPESDNELLEVDVTGKTIYVVGGLIDRSVKKFASFDRANELGVKTARLPINPFMEEASRRCLNIDTVTIIMGLAV